MTTENVKKLEDYVNDINANREKAWSVSISHKVKSDEYFAFASIVELERKLGMPEQSLRRKTSASEHYAPLMKKLNDILKEEDVLLKGESASALEIRRSCLHWWKGLSLQDKKDISTHGNKIQFKKYVKNWRIEKGYELVKKLEKELNDELIDLGVLDKSYVAVKDRDALFDKEYRDKQEQGVKRWEELGAKPIESYKEFVSVDSKDEPYVQFKQLAALVRAQYSSSSTKNKYREIYTHLCRFFELNDIPKNASLEDLLSEFLLVRFKQDYIVPKVDNGDISPSNAPTIISSLRMILRRAIKLKDLQFNNFHDVESNFSGRSTETYKPYAKTEREAINNAIESDIKRTLNLLIPYVKTGEGDNPLADNGNIKPGYAKEVNARYLFENNLNCRPINFRDATSVAEKGFIKIIQKIDEGLHDIYRKWGVLSLIDADVVAPFVFRLAQITGMNAEPLFDLELDDFVAAHDTTLKPCLRYWKERSTGEKEVHLDLFEAKLQWLSQKQSVEVKALFENVIRLTDSIRHDAPESIKNKLFLFQSSGQRCYGEIRSFSSLKGKTTSIYSNFANRHDLQNEEGEKLVFNISRFRPTFVSELVEAGVSIREIQLMLGHSNIETTMNYLDRLDFNRIAREKLVEALSNIHSKTIVPKNGNGSKHLENPDRVIFTTPLGGCSNIFAPPDFIKKMSGFKNGQACSQYNKCLSCENIMITVDKLPMLFAMKRDYMILMQRNRIMDSPYGYVIQENLSLLDEILHPEKSDFDNEDLVQAEHLSLFEETAIVDGVTA